MKREWGKSGTEYRDGGNGNRGIGVEETRIEELGMEEIGNRMQGWRKREEKNWDGGNRKQKTSMEEM